MTLREDVLMQTAVGRVDALASSPTLCRLEKRATRAQAGRCTGCWSISSSPATRGRPSELVLDIDASDIPLHGQQERAEFHGYYDLTATCRCTCSAAKRCWRAARPSHIDGAKNAAAVIKLLMQRLRQAWPDVRIIVRGDSGFCRQRLMRWCERSGVGYIIGLARNARLEAQVRWPSEAGRPVRAHGIKQRLIDEFGYAAESWDTSAA